MNEVSTQAAALLLDALERQGLESDVVWRGLPVTREHVRRRGHVDWDTWVAMVARVEQHAAAPLEDLFVPGAGSRSGHPFVQIASGLVSLREIYALFARWGIRQTFLTGRAYFEMQGHRRGRFVFTFDPARTGSFPTMRFMVGLLRSAPRLLGHPPARVRMLDGATGHHAEYEIELPVERGFVARARRLVGGVFGGVTAALDELESQADEIAAKNHALRQQLTETRERKEWLDVALASSRIGLWRWDPAKRRVRISPQLADWLGVPGESEIDSSVWGALVHPDDRPELIAMMLRALESREAYEMDYRIVRPSGEILWLQVKGRTEAEPSGHIYAYGSTIDVTEKKLMDSRMRRADRLIAAGTLAAGIAHEVNNPLTYVIGSLDLMQRRLAQHPAAREVTLDLIAQILDGCERIRAVVADIGTFARHDDNAVVPVDLSTVCARVIRIVSSDVRHRAIVELDFAADTPAVLANDSRLSQVMINLIVNASQAMPAGRATGENRITIRTRRLPSGEATLEVEDNGTGIDPVVVPRVFDPFFTTKPIGVGTGLGLSVCQGIVTSLGGRIELASTLGRGSVFTVTLQAAASDDPEASKASSGRRVLVIDDDSMIRSVVARTLTAQGFAVDEAENGRDGLARAVGEEHYDAILCDLMMPDLDGVALHDELLAKLPGLVARIVFISGGAVSARIQTFLQTPGIVVLQKPFAFERLLEAIERAAQGTSTSLPLT